MCPLVEAKADIVARRAYMLATVVTSDFDAIPAVFHGHVVLVTDLRTKSHQLHLAVELFCLVVDLLAVIDEIRPSGSHVEVMLTTPPSMAST